MDYVSIFNKNLAKAVGNMPAFTTATVEVNTDNSDTTNTIHYDTSELDINTDSVPNVFTDSTGILNASQTIMVISGDIPTVMGTSPWVSS
jgi:hypothetical protein